MAKTTSLVHSSAYNSGDFTKTKMKYGTMYSPKKDTGKKDMSGGEVWDKGLKPSDIGLRNAPKQKSKIFKRGR